MTYLGIMYTDLFNKFERLLIFFYHFISNHFGRDQIHRSSMYKWRKPFLKPCPSVNGWSKYFPKTYNFRRNWFILLSKSYRHKLGQLNWIWSADTIWQKQVRKLSKIHCLAIFHATSIQIEFLLLCYLYNHFYTFWLIQ